MAWSQLDIWIIIAYFALMIGLSLWHRKFAAGSMENFFLGGRKVPGWLNGVSYSAALVSPDAATGYGGLAAVTGAFISWWYLSRFGLALFLAGVLFAFFWRRLNLFTSLEFYDLRFKPRTANAMRLWIATRTSLIAMPAWTGITLLAACKIMEPAFGFSKMETLALIVPVSFVFVFFSGYKGVVISNLIQMTIFMIGAMTLAFFTLQHFGGATQMVAAIQDTFGATNPEITRLTPPPNHEVFPLMAALAWMVGQSIGYGGDAAPMGGAMEGQRILSTRSPKEALTMYVVTAVTMFILLLLVTLPSISAAVIWPELREPGFDREEVYGMLMKEMLPAGAIGILVAAMLAATMSTVADNLNFGGQVLVSDIYRRWFVRNQSEKHYLRMGKLAMGLILGVSLAVVFHVHFIVDVAIFMLQLSAAELPANWAQWWWWRFNGKARIAASFGGALFFCLVVLVPKILIYFHIPLGEQLLLPWWWQTLLVMGATTLLWVLVALFTKPDPDQLLQRFHDRVKPLGLWGKYAQHGPAGNRRTNVKPIMRGIALAIVGFVAICLLVIGITDLWFANYSRGAYELLGAAVMFFIFHKGAAIYLNALTDRDNNLRKINR
ncbi:MAG TPA: hypothetical protein VNQ80_17035 [Parapedobacter sp.]|uniref:sodium:solute symporter family transporter n=1 Tax=Parapedobacter sp. TaxID=1958893 RepID=UPI002B6EE427|nr:hypothetical protein [Parapedobacter sp.]HWK59052.1 hypothetical protein [Parapedobacter sp.]